MNHHGFLPAGLVHMAGPLSAFAARMAASANLPAEQLHLTPLRRKAGLPKSLPRQNRPAPTPSRQFLRAMSTQVSRDRRLTRTAVALAPILVAQAGKGTTANVTRRYLAMVSGLSVRSVARGLAELIACGYIMTNHRLGTFGQTIGLRVELLDPLVPPFEGAETQLSPLINTKILILKKGLAGSRVHACQRESCKRLAALCAGTPWSPGGPRR